MSCRWTKTLINCFEVLILSFKILFSILGALTSSAKSEYDWSGMFFSFMQYERSSYSKGVAEQFKGVVHMTVGCDLVVDSVR